MGPEASARHGRFFQERLGGVLPHLQPSLGAPSAEGLFMASHWFALPRFAEFHLVLEDATVAVIKQVPFPLTTFLAVVWAAVRTCRASLPGPPGS